jgi:hypothetical protein
MRWYAAARLYIRTEDPAVTVADLLTAWQRVKHPAGTTLADAVKRAGRDTYTTRYGGVTDHTARLLRSLDHIHGGRMYRLSYRLLGKSIAASREMARAAAITLEAAGLVEITPGMAGEHSRIATEWRWIGPPQTDADLEPIPGNSP